MAQREGQGLQIAVISFAMLTIILAITTYIFYAQSQTAQKDVEQKTKALSEKQNEANKLKYHVKAMQYALGAKDVALSDVELAEKTAGGSDAEAKEVLENFNNDIALLGDQVAPEGPRSYRTFVTALLGALAKKNASIADANEQLKKQMADKDAAEQAAKARADVAAAASEKAVADYKAETDNFVSMRAQSDEEKKKLTDQLAASTARAAKEQQRVNDEKEVFIKQNTQLLGNNKVLRERIDKVNEGLKDLFENPDGHIIKVDQRLRMAWIDVGRADGLLRQTTFSVYDHNEKGAATDKSKARLEVVSLSDHQAEARILEDTPKNPIIAGDIIHSPAWSPGQRVHFALAMKMDINKDRIDDYDMIKSIIQMNGGVIDAELRADGTRKGNISVNTRYFVEGEKPSEATSAELLKQYNAFDGDRERFGVQKISVDKLLSLMGWKAEERTVELAGPRSTSDFRKRAPAKTQPAAAGASEANAPAAGAPATTAPAGADPFAAPAAPAAAPAAADPFAAPPPAGKAAPPAEADPFAAPK
jgi:hypothetical protein